MRHSEFQIRRNMTYNVNNICRLCIQESNRLRPLFENNEDLLTKIQILAPDVKVTAEDGLPTRVCERCVTQLNSSCEFKILLEASYASLRDKLRQLQDAEFHEILYIKDEPISDEEMESDIARIEVNENREVVNGGDSELDPLSIKSEEASSIPLGSCTETQLHNGSEINSQIENAVHHGKLAAIEDIPLNLVNCTECKKKFTTEAGLKVHSSYHVSSKIIKCPICKKSFVTAQMWKDHDCGENFENSFPCSLCDKIFNTERGLKIHNVKYHMSEQEYECSVCYKTFTSEIELSKHVQNHIEERQHECSVCKERFETGLELRLHSRSHVGIEALPNSLFKCSICKKKFATVKAINTHRRFCIKSSSISIDVDDSFDSSDIKLTNPYTLKNKGTFKCCYCKKLYNKLKAVRTHEAHCRRWHHSSNDAASKRLVNESLQMSFKNVNAMQYACTLCSQSFSSLKDLINHRGVHFNTHVPLHDSNSSVFYKYDLSSQRFSMKGNINTLKAQHSFKEKDSNMDTSLIRESNQKTSVYSHTSSNLTSPYKPHKFSCAVCKQVFNTCRGLAVHRWRNHHEIEEETNELTDTKQRSIQTLNASSHDKVSFRCSICELNFDSSRALSMHRWHKHRPKEQQRTTLSSIPQRFRNDGIYMCHLCDKRFNTNKERIIHNLTYHGFRKRLNKTFTTSDNACRGIHVRYQNIGVFTCHVCMQTFSSRTLLLKHKWLMHRAKQQKASSISVIPGTSYGSNENCFACSICSKSFNTKRLLSKHKWYEHKYKVKKLAAMLSKKESNSGSHKFQEHGSKHICPICKRSFNSLKSVAKHKWHRHRHRSQEPATISNISKKISSEQQISQHYYYKKYTCHVCVRGFKSSRALNIHNWQLHRKQGARIKLNANEVGSISNEGYQTSHDSQDIDLYSCTICVCKFSSYKNFATHLLWHRHKERQLKICGTDYPANKTFTCSDCTLNFSSAEELSHHRTKHTDTNNSVNNQYSSYSCHKCLFSFNDIISFESHQKSCGKGSSAATHRTNGMEKTNRDISNLSCNVCQISFDSPSALLVHKNDHVEEGITGQGTNDSENSMVSTGSITATHSCHFCMQIFESEEQLVNHTKVHEKNEGNQQLNLYRNTVSGDTSIIPLIDQGKEDMRKQSEKCHNTVEQSSKSYSHDKKRTEEDRNTQNQVCSKTFNSTHECSHHSTKPHSLKNTEENNAEQSIILDTENKLQQGKIHSTSFKNEICTKENESSSSEQNYISCINCSKVFKSLNGLLIHNSHCHPWSAATEKSNNLALENVTVNDDELLQTNSNHDSSSELNDFCCNVCNKTFKSSLGLLIHNGKLHPVTNPEEYNKRDHERALLVNGECQKHEQAAVNDTEEETNGSKAPAADNVHSNRLLEVKSLKHTKTLESNKSHIRTDANEENEKMPEGNKSFQVTQEEEELLSITEGLNCSNRQSHQEQFQDDPDNMSEIQIENLETTSFQCTICNSTFATERNMTIHKGMAHRQKCDSDIVGYGKKKSPHDRTCDDGDGDPSKKLPDNDSNIIAESTKQQCNLCPRTFKHERSLLFHKALFHKAVFHHWNNTDARNSSRQLKMNEEDRKWKETKMESKSKNENVALKTDNRRCSVCSRLFRSFHGVVVHYAMIHQKHPLKREKEENVSSSSRLNETSSTDTPKVKFHQIENNTSYYSEDIDSQCNICSKIFKSAHGLLIHMKKIHSSTNTNLTGKTTLPHCLPCRKTFLNQRGLSVHSAKFHCKSIHKNILFSEKVSRIYKCTVCSATFTSLKGLGIHSGRFHGVFLNLKNEENNESEGNVSLQSTLYKCKICFKVFDKKAVLKAHLEEVHHNTVQNPQPFKQNIPDSGLNMGEFEYGCVSCKKNFSSLMDLRKHCHECHSRNSSDQESLNISDQHGNEELFHSEQYEIQRKTDIQRDSCVTTATSIKQLKCPICGKVSYSSVGLKVHCKRIHGVHWNDLETSQFVTINFSDESNTESIAADSSFKCHLCNKLFSNSDDLQVHFETAHKQKVSVENDFSESMDVSFTESNGQTIINNVNEGSLTSVDISLSEAIRMPSMSVEENNVESAAVGLLEVPSLNHEKTLDKLQQT